MVSVDLRIAHSRRKKNSRFHTLTSTIVAASIVTSRKEQCIVSNKSFNKLTTVIKNYGNIKLRVSTAQRQIKNIQLKQITIANRHPKDRNSHLYTTQTGADEVRQISAANNLQQCWRIRQKTKTGPLKNLHKQIQNEPPRTWWKASTTLSLNVKFKPKLQYRKKATIYDFNHNKIDAKLHLNFIF